jgi:hypothetical protein
MLYVVRCTFYVGTLYVGPLYQMSVAIQVSLFLDMTNIQGSFGSFLFVFCLPKNSTFSECNKKAVNYFKKEFASYMLLNMEFMQKKL